jgi:UDP-N-acetylmuramate dehydrogenase
VPIEIRENVPLAPLTTFELGGPARFFVEAAEEGAALEALEWAARRGLSAFVMGGGSNLVVPDAGVEGLVMKVASRGVTFRPGGAHILCEAKAGEPWDGVVAAAVCRGLAGLECLSGIPGSTGGTPVQNVGAYGQEVADTIDWVRVFDRRAGVIRDLAPEPCRFAYRDSAFKRDPQGHVVLAATFRLRPGAPEAARYPELKAALAGKARPELAEVREAVLALRRKKSMVIDPGDPNRRSAGSFFTNPVLPVAEAEAVVERALAAGLARTAEEVPRFAVGPGQVKLAAGWMVERAGIARGVRSGAVGISSNHALALVHHGGGTTAELLAFARHVRTAVHERFGVWLIPEPVVLGASAEDPLVLAAS